MGIRKGLQVHGDRLINFSAVDSDVALDVIPQAANTPMAISVEEDINFICK